jgi:putative CRISPR-associated protein (TIGR02619 family)
MAHKLVALTTVGTSLLGNSKNSITDEELKKSIKADFSNLSDQIIKDFIRINIQAETEKRISAEINSTIQLNNYIQEKEERKIDIVHLILSDTGEMKKQEPILRRFFTSKGFQVEITTVNGLKYKESQFKMSGLRSLINELSKLIENYRGKGYEVLMNATGGFKAEIAYATVLAQLRHIKSFYVYETFNEIVPMPFLPLNLDIAYWRVYKEYFSLYEKGLEKEKSDEYLTFLPQGFRFLIDWNEIENKWYLNPAGEAFYLSFLGEEEIYLQEIDSKKVFRKSNETTLWNKAVNTDVQTLEDIPDRDVKELLRRVLRFNFVKKIELIDYHEVGVSQGDTHLKFRSKSDTSLSHYVRYEIKCRNGRQSINIMVDNGFCDELVFMLGKKVYP